MQITTKKETRQKTEKRFHFSKVIIYFVLIIWAITTIFPFVWVINNSFKESSLVISDSFSLALGKVYRYDKYGQIVHRDVLKDEYGRDMYDKLLVDADGNPVLEKDTVGNSTITNSALSSMFSGMQQKVDPAIADLQAYDKTNGKILYDMDSPKVLRTPTFANYTNAFTNNNVNILRGYKNSLIVSGSVMLFVMLLSTMLAFAMTRYKFKGRKILNSMIVAALMFPAFSTIVPVYRMLAGWNLFDTLQGVIIVQTAGNLAFACTVMIGFVSALPYELEEAAFMEGCGVFRIFTKIILPMSKPALATVAIFTFLWSYNDLFVQMVLLRSKALMPVCAILREISSQYGTDFGLMAAAVTIIIIPVLVVYMLLQKNIIKGLTAGAVKG